MNALEMMANSLAKQLPDLIAKAAANLPPEVLANIGQIRDIVSSYKAQLDRIESELALLKAALNPENDHGHQ